jgi:predicted AAA+ superfamily ATPase
MEVTYVRTPGGYEVDFLARRPGEPPELIQVCADLGTAEVVERELRALEDVAKTYPKATRRNPRSAFAIPPLLYGRGVRLTVY